MQGECVVLDTNCLVMSLSARNAYSRIWQGFVTGDYVLCVSNEILEEYEEVLGRNISPKVARIVLAYIQVLPNVKLIDPHYSFGLIKADVDDNKFVDCAIASNATFIVSEDKHFRELDSIPFPKVEVIGIDDFMKYLDRNKH